MLGTAARAPLEIFPALIFIFPVTNLGSKESLSFINRSLQRKRLNKYVFSRPWKYFRTL